MKTDICIIGAGPAGLTAAIFAAKNGADTILLDSNTASGKKLLRTGRGRCNLTHTGSIQDFITSYGQFGKFLQHSLHEFPPSAIRDFFTQNRLQTKVEKNGRVFPMTDRATDIKRILMDNIRAANVRCMFGKKVSRITKTKQDFTVHITADKIICQKVIIATGGLSWPHTGSKGDGYKFAEKLGHNITKPKAALVSLVTKEKWPTKIPGVGLEKVKIKATVNDQKKETTGEIMFTHQGLGGPAIFDLSRFITDPLTDAKKPITISIDLAPDASNKQLDQAIIDQCQKQPKKELAGILTNLLPRSMALELCKQFELTSVIANQLSKQRRQKLVTQLKKLSLTITSTRPIAEATITRGGVATKQINPKTMRSKICKNLFFAGEVIDVDGPCGGYNLQIAWSTGALAGKNAAK